MMSSDRSIDHFLLATARPKNYVPILLSELINENALGPPIPFTERVHCIDLSEIMRQPTQEVDSRKSMPFRCKLREDGLGVRFNSWMRSKEGLVSWNIDGMESSSPTVNILEKTPMYRLEMSEVESRLARMQPELGLSKLGQLSFL
jgi:hypothetical protein